MQRSFLKLVGALFIFCVCYVSLHKGHAIFRRQEVDPSIIERLNSAAVHLILNGDVPVAAVLVYTDEIIGVGGNTVLKNSTQLATQR